MAESAARTMSDVEIFLAALVRLCKKHGAVLFPRTDGKRQVLSVQIGEIWIDLKRVGADGAGRWNYND